MQSTVMSRGGGSHNGRGRAASAPRGRGRGGSSAPEKGFFINGLWSCNCIPRLPAEHFKVKKEGPNKGRWFYTCQKSNEERCGFFLWEEDARVREEAAVLSKGRNEPVVHSDAQDGWDAARSATQGGSLFASKTSGPATRAASLPPPSSPSPRPTAANASRKRTAQDAQLSDGDDEPWALTGAEEKELAFATSSSEMETPRKAQKTGVYATPDTTGNRSKRKLPWLQEPISPQSMKKTLADYFKNTPSKPPARVHFAEPDSPGFEDPASPIREEVPDTAQPPPTLAAAPGSPSPPTRYRDALVNPADAASSLTGEVLAELTNTNLPPEKLSSLRSILSKHDLKTQGVTKGRDISRLAIKAKEARIVELEARVASLEAQREVDRGVIARLRWTKDLGREVEDDSQL